MKESQLDNKTSIATNDYVRMVDENGNSVKIKKDSFMAAIRDALPSIISDGETGGGSVLSIIGGALKSRTDANLASVLGGVVTQITANQNIDDIKTAGNYITETNTIAQSITGTRPPLSRMVAFRLEVRMTIEGRPIQRFYDFEGNSFSRGFNSNVWSTWSRADAFGCGTAADLASLLGVVRGTITTDADYVLSDGTKYGYGLLIISNFADGTASMYNVDAFNVERISNTDCGATVTKNSEYTLVIKRPSGKSTGFVLVSLR